MMRQLSITSLLVLCLALAQSLPLARLEPVQLQIFERS